MDSLRAQILNYVPESPREESDKTLILRCIDTFSDTLTRNNLICHFTASNWIINTDHTKALMIYHNIEQKWMWTGGHADGESDLLAVALREAKEETNLSHIKILKDGVFSLEVLSVPPHIRKGIFVSSHLHLNCGFLLEANEYEPFKIKPDENSDIRWMSFEEIIDGSRQGTMAPHYIGLIEKVKNLSH